MLLCNVASRVILSDISSSNLCAFSESPLLVNFCCTILFHNLCILVNRQYWWKYRRWWVWIIAGWGLFHCCNGKNDGQVGINRTKKINWFIGRGILALILMAEEEELTKPMFLLTFTQHECWYPYKNYLYTRVLDLIFGSNCWTDLDFIRAFRRTPLVYRLSFLFFPAEPKLNASKIQSMLLCSLEDIPIQCSFPRSGCKS